MRLLFLTPFVPRLHGRHGGARVTGQLIAGLASRHEVAVLCLRERGGAPVEEELQRNCERIEVVERRATGTGVRDRVGSKIGLLQGIPTWAGELAEPELGVRAAQLAAEWDPDVVQLEFTVMGQYAPVFAACAAPTVLVEHDASLHDARRWGGPFPAVTQALDDRAWRRFEARVLGAVDAAVVFTERDRRALDALATGTPVVSIGLGVPIPERPLSAGGESPPSVVFVGNFVHPPNTEAALWLARALFPPLLATYPDARLTLVGAGPPPELRALAGPSVIVTGEVPDVTPYLDEAAVVAAPVLSGGGMRVKVLEALAAGKAVVATPLAVEGLSVAPGKQLEIAATEEQFVEALRLLLGDESRRRELAASARTWAREHAGWERAIVRYEELYASLVR